MTVRKLATPSKYAQIQMGINVPVRRLYRSVASGHGTCIGSGKDDNPSRFEPTEGLCPLHT